MQKKIISFLLTAMNFVFVISAGAQPAWQKLWDYRYGGTNYEALRSFIQTTDNGFLMGGYSQSNINGNKTAASNGSYDYWLVKTDSLGIKEWDKSFGGNSGDEFSNMQQTSDSGFILGGYSVSGISGDKTQASWGGWDYWIVKTDALGNKQWDKRYGGINNEVLASIKQTTDGGYILGGVSDSGIGGDKTQTSFGFVDYWIVKIDAIGTVQWDKRFGGNDFDYLQDMEQTSDGGYILAGYTSSPVSGNKTLALTGLEDYWIIKIDALGNKLWEKNYGGSLSNKLTAIHQTDDDGFIIGGLSISGVSGNKSQPTWGFFDAWIIKTDSLGNIQWERDFGGDQNDEVNFIELTSDGGYLVSGDSYSTLSGDKSESNLGQEQTWILKLDSNGNKLWDKTIFTNGHDEVGKAIVAPDGCYVISNMTNSGIGGYKTEPNWDATNVSYDYWIVKFRDTTTSIFAPTINLASSDTFFCEKQCIDFYDLSANSPTSWGWFFPGSDSATSSLQNPTGICYQTYGSFDVTLIACNNAGCDTLIYYGFINEYQNPKDSIWSSNDTLYSLTFPSYQWYEVTGGIIAGATNQYFVPTQLGSYYCVVGDTIGCVSTSNIIALTATASLLAPNGEIAIVPNPFSDHLFINLKNNQQSEITFFDITSRKLLHQTFTNSTSINAEQLAKGIYFYEVKCKAEVIGKGKVVKE